jgi:hypothetical protein
MKLLDDSLPTIKQGGELMMRRALIIGLTLATGILAFAATSLAVDQDPEPRLRANLPAAALPVVSLNEQEAVRINNALGTVSSRVGITPDSYKEVRLVTTTAVGPMYLIPGTRGVCLYFDDGASCGDPGGSGGRINALATMDSSGDRIVGGGVADASVDRVEVDVVGHGVRQFVPVRRGVFSIDISVPGFEPGKGINFIAR